MSLKITWLGWYSPLRWHRDKRVLVMQHAFDSKYRLRSLCGGAKPSEGRPVRRAPHALICLRCWRILERKGRWKK